MSSSDKVFDTKIVMVGDWEGSGLTVDETLDQVFERWCDTSHRYADRSIPCPMRLTRDGETVLVNPQMIEMVYAK